MLTHASAGDPWPTTYRFVVRLYAAGGAGLIFPRATGVVYSNQTGGLSCLQPGVEGVYVPIGDPDLAFGTGAEPALMAYFAEVHEMSGAPDGLDPWDADAIDAILRATHLEGCVEVDRSRLNDSYEAWVHVRVFGPRPPYADFSGLGPYPCEAVLTWNNSD